MLPKLKQFFEAIAVIEILTGHLKTHLDSNISENVDTDFDETIERKTLMTAFQTHRWVSKMI